MSKEKKKRPVGRPTKYCPELLDAAQEYLNIYEDLDQVIPTIEGLSLYLDISRDTLYNWCDDENKKEFSYTVRRLIKIQKQVLLNKGLEGKFNAKITQLLLGANHSVIEKSSQEISGPNGGAQEHKWEVEFISSDDKKDDKD